MKKDLYTNILLFVCFNLAIYSFWLAGSYFSFIQTNKNFQTSLDLESHDLYKISQNIEALTKKNIIDCATIEDNNFVYFSSFQKFNCKNLIFLGGFFYKIETVNKIKIEYRYKNSHLNSYLLFISMLFSNFFLVCFLLFLKKEKEKELYRVNQIEKKSKLSQKLAHDIRSPISTLSLLSSQIENPSIKELQNSVLAQINQIASEILKTEKSANTNDFEIKKTSAQAPTSYFSLLKQIQQEYSLKYAGSKYTLCFDLKNEIQDIAIYPPGFLYTAINNLIQNAIEATESLQSPKVSVAVNLSSGPIIYFKIEDNGPGIPKEILSHLGKKTISKGKSGLSGNGIGVFNAAEDLRQVQGSINFSSTDYGTTVEFFIPVTLF